ncbi:MAG: GspH/FimT family pseudopilin [Pseudomonadota bacterium]
MTTPLLRLNARRAGLTLVELLFVIALVSILALAAAPSLGQLLATIRLRAEINALHHSVHRARRESIKRNAYVVVCPSVDGQRCETTGNWNAGWLVYVENGVARPPQRSPAELRLAAHRVPDGVRILANRRYFVSRTRRYRATNGTILACDQAARVDGRALVISYTGRPRAVPEKALNGRLAC